MYRQPAFEEERLDVLHDLIRAHPLAALVVLQDGEITANHIPMILAADEGEQGVLRGHISKANPLGKGASSSVEALAIFQGPQAYVSPSWYPSKAEHGKAVPTWNYAVVHAHGPLRFIDDPQSLREHVERLTFEHEQNRPDPWSTNDAPEAYIGGLLKGVVGVELPIARLEGKWKMSQNKNDQDRLGVSDGLANEGQLEMAQQVRKV